MAYTVAEVEHGEMASSYVCSTNRHEENREAEHPGLEIIYDLKSPLEMILRGQRKIIQNTQFLIYNAREAHTEIHSASTTALRSLVIEEPFVNALLQELGFDFKEIIFEQTQFQPSPLILEQIKLIHAARRASALLPTLEELVVAQLALEILTTLPHSHSEKLLQALGSGLFPTTMAKAKKLIFAQLREGRLDLATLASDVGMSKFHFLRSFKRELTLTPLQYINRVKLEVAKMELQAGRKTVTDIAFGLGFDHLSTFYALFQRETQLEPKAFAQTSGSRIDLKTYSHRNIA